MTGSRVSRLSLAVPLFAVFTRSVCSKEFIMRSRIALIAALVAVSFAGIATSSEAAVIYTVDTYMSIRLLEEVEGRNEETKLR